MLEALIKGITLGLLLSISVGPVIFSIIKQSLNNGHTGGMAFVFGVSAADIALALRQRVDKRPPINGQRHRAAQFGVAERRLLTVQDHVAVDVGRHQATDCLRVLSLRIVQHRHLKEIRRRYIVFAGQKGELPGRLILDNRPFDAVKIGPVLFPVIGIAHHLHIFVRLEFDELERSCADRMLPHVARGDMARIDRREARG